MRIAITGSWRDEDAADWGLHDGDGFFAATRAIGAELVKLGHRLVVASDAPHTADRAAVEGAAEALPRDGVYDDPVVDLLQPGRDAFAELAARRPGFFNPRTAPANRRVVKLYQVHLADAVLAIGGADGTLQAAIAAAVSGRRVVPVGAFGGAAAQAVQVFEATSGRWGPHVPPHDRLGPLALRWTPGSAELVLRAIGARHPKVLIVHGRDHASRDALVRLLVELGLPQPIVMAAQPELGRTLPQKFQDLAEKVDAAIALVTEDDLGRLRDETDVALRGRARQNVWVEVGWFWGKLGLARTMLLGRKGVEMPSDLSGLLVAEFDASPVELEHEIAQWVESLGWPRPVRGSETSVR